ncbi:type II toxin-antitoxin system ParD family antitoxin [Methylobacterium sp. 2A]|nr:type II toxin-antitoxin system ParD family antitoxin [Methylobacterium sp. 2A]
MHRGHPALRASKPITAALGEPRALDREKAALEAILRQRVQEALDDPRPAILADQVFADLHAHHAQRMRAAKRGA